MMKLGVFNPILGEKSLEEALTYLKSLGVEAVELGCGGYPGKSHVNPDVLLKDDKALNRFQDTIRNSGLVISALSAHGNPVHPDKAEAARFHDDFQKAVLLAEALGIDTVNGFSGCPGDHPGAQYPNWVTCPWPEDFGKILRYQWDDVLIPYWQKTAAWAKEHGVTKIALEMHPGFAVYNPYTLLKLRAAAGDNIGTNFDPSHLIWQGMDPVAAIRELEGVIYHFHAKDTKVDPYNCAKNGVLDTRPYVDKPNRSWIFRTVGYGNGESFWRDICSALMLVGYDHVLSIEHEDGLMTNQEGLEKAVFFLQGLLIREPRTSGMPWA